MDRRGFVRAVCGAVALCSTACTSARSGDDPAEDGPPSGGTDLGALEELRAAAADEPVQVAGLRAVLVSVPPAERDVLAAAYGPPVDVGIRQGWLLLHDRCTHLGCRVTWCEGSGLFECPCHGTVFTRFGEHGRGPAESGLRPVVVEVFDGHLWTVGPVLPAPATGPKPLPAEVVVSADPVGDPECVGPL